MRHLHPRADMFGLVQRPDRYRRLTGGPFRRVHARVVADVVGAGLPDGARVLDIGTGPGGVPLAIAEATALVVDGLDLSPAMVAHARAAARGRVRYTLGNVAALPWPDRTFDLIVSSMSQHHWADVPGALAEIRRTLRPGGEAWIYDARIALRRLASASVRIEPVRTGRLPVRLIGRARLKPLSEGPSGRDEHGFA